MQLPLPVSLPSDETFDSFVEGDNQELVNLLKGVAEASAMEGDNWRDSATLKSVKALSLPLLTIIGNEGRGKSHLLYALCHLFADANTPHVYLNFSHVADWQENVFEGLESIPFVCLDNIDKIAGSTSWELALFDFLNRVSESRHTFVICTSRFGASHPEFTLPDLRSRLTWGVTYTLKQINDEQRKEAIQRRAQQRGLEFSEQAIQFLLNHSQRDLPSLMTTLDRLDTRSLQEQKKISVAMIKRELAI